MQQMSSEFWFGELSTPPIFGVDLNGPRIEPLRALSLCRHKECWPKQHIVTRQRDMSIQIHLQASQSLNEMDLQLELIPSIAYMASAIQQQRYRRRSRSGRVLLAPMRIPSHVGHRFRAMSVQHSEACRSTMPGHVGPSCDAG